MHRGLVAAWTSWYSTGYPDVLANKTGCRGALAANNNYSFFLQSPNNKEILEGGAVIPKYMFKTFLPSKNIQQLRVERHLAFYLLVRRGDKRQRGEGEEGQKAEQLHGLF